jgi:hypothetical protein
MASMAQTWSIYIAGITRCVHEGATLIERELDSRRRGPGQYPGWGPWCERPSVYFLPSG